METMLETLGYTRDAAQNAKETFIRKSTGSAANLNKVAGSEKVHIPDKVGAVEPEEKKWIH